MGWVHKTHLLFGWDLYFIRWYGVGWYGVLGDEEGTRKFFFPIPKPKPRFSKVKNRWPFSNWFPFSQGFKGLVFQGWNQINQLFNWRKNWFPGLVIGAFKPLVFLPDSLLLPKGWEVWGFGEARFQPGRKILFSSLKARICFFQRQLERTGILVGLF